MALLLFLLTASDLTGLLMGAQRARRTSRRWMQATQLAAEELERLRAGDRRADAGPIGIFTRTWSEKNLGDGSRLHRLDVTVRWDEAGPREFRLSTLMRAAR